VSGDTPWGPVELQGDDAVEYRLGDLVLRLRRRAGEVWMHSTHDVELPERVSPRGPWISRFQGDEAFSDLPSEAWLRWALSMEEGLELRPALPDRLVVVSPEQSFSLAPEGRARVFVRIPLFIQVRTTGELSDATTLEELPSIVLSDTWWGSFTEGELGYWLETRARRAIGPELLEPFVAISPLLLLNRSDQPLAVERFAVRVAHLTLFGRGHGVWTDELQVRYEGGAEGSEIRYTGRVPEDAGDVVKLAEARVPAPRGLQALTFGRLKAKMGAL